MTGPVTADHLLDPTCEHGNPLKFCIDCILELLNEGEPTVISPTVGRVVWVIRPFDTMDIKQPEVGLVTYVWNDRLVNVAGYNQNGTPFSLTSLRLLQDDEAKPEGSNFAVWMPYQKGQAAKTEALEAAAR